METSYHLTNFFSEMTVTFTMLPDAIITGFLLLIILSLLLRAVYESQKRSKAEPRGGLGQVKDDWLVVTGAVFALVFYLEVLIFAVLFLTDSQTILTSSLLQISFPMDSLIQVIGMILVLIGISIVFWALMVLDYNNLTTNGPYKYVRHPQYLGYFFVFPGFFLLTLNLLALLPLLSFPGQIRMAKIEDNKLQKMYGEEYVQYSKKTNSFFPKV